MGARILSILQLMRVALALTAVADVWTVLLLKLPGQAPLAARPWQLLFAGIASFFLYSFGMVLNDLLDMGRDRFFAPARPLPSGRISPAAAIVLAVLCLLLSLFFAAMLVVFKPHEVVPVALFLALGVALLIVFYNAAGKYLGATGLLTLGLIRGLNCQLGRPEAPFLLVSAVLITHVAFASTVAYFMEVKRPRLRRRDVVGVLAGILMVDGLLLAAMVFWRQVDRNFILACGALAAVFAAYGIWVAAIFSRHHIPLRQRGRQVMRVGLFWLFTYDAVLLGSYGQWDGALAIIALGLVSGGLFITMRLTGRGLMKKPQYRLTASR